MCPCITRGVSKSSCSYTTIISSPFSSSYPTTCPSSPSTLIYMESSTTTVAEGNPNPFQIFEPEHIHGGERLDGAVEGNCRVGGGT